MTQIKPISNINIDELLEVYNDSFKDYVSPFKLSKEELQAKIICDKIDLNLSFGIYNLNRLVGFILHSVNKEQSIAYNAGTGIVSNARNKGNLTKSYKIIKSILSKNGIKNLVHEVRVINDNAIKAYQKNGFKINRELAVYIGDISENNLSNRISIIKSNTKTEPKNFINEFDYSPSWLNSIEQIEFTKVDVYLAKINNKIVGFLIYKPQSKRLLQIFIIKKFRRLKIGTTLLQYIRSINERLLIVNVHNNDETKKFFESNGLKQKFIQYEMYQEI
jgi:ribosomal protein S18 acetylase RimI-like enzyme